jgi:hypothetical protein
MLARHNASMKTQTTKPWKHLASASLLLMALGARPLLCQFQTEAVELGQSMPEDAPCEASSGADTLLLGLAPGYYSCSAAFSAATANRKILVYSRFERCRNKTLRLSCKTQHALLREYQSLSPGAETDGIPVQKEPEFLILAVYQTQDASGNTVWAQSPLQGSSMGLAPGASRPTRLSLEFNDSQGGKDTLTLISAQD